MTSTKIFYLLKKVDFIYEEVMNQIQRLHMEKVPTSDQGQDEPMQEEGEQMTNKKQDQEMTTKNKDA